MGTGTVWTETDVAPDGWYLDRQAACRAGLMIEAGQADLLLISWLGVDLLDQGERVYRLLGCEVTFHGSPALAGETLRYEIHVDQHAEHGDVRLFFFHYDCYAGDDLRMTRAPRAGGLLHRRRARQHRGRALGRRRRWRRMTGRWPPAVPAARRSFDAAEVRAFAEGARLTASARRGPRRRARAHAAHRRRPDAAVRHESPTSIPREGRWARGYLRAEAP